MDFTEEAVRLCDDAEEGRTESLASAPGTDLQIGSVGATKQSVHSRSK